MEVFLLRHGTRNFTLGDVPLNEEGLQQAKDLAAMDHWEPLSGLLSSPRKRAMMTVQPIAERWGFSLSIFEDLDQVRGGEGEIEFHARVKNFIKRVEEKEFL